MPDENDVFDALKYRSEVDKLGTRRYRNAAGQLHREEGPAIVYNDGTEKWYQNGKLHREDGPAVTYKHGPKIWFKHGKRHRTDGPAAEYHNGGTIWFLDDKPCIAQTLITHK